MTDHHDELASAYLDGQLTPEEGARVENDPALMAEVDALASVVERLQSEEAPVDPTTRHRHLSAALAAFDHAGFDRGGLDQGAGPVDLDGAAPTAVVPLDPAAGRTLDEGDSPARAYPQRDDVARRTARVASAPAGGDELAARRRVRSQRRAGLPSWLSAAAALLVIGGGIGWFMSRQDASDTAAVTFGQDDPTDEAGGADKALAEATSSGDPPTSAAAASVADAGRNAAADGAGSASEAQAAVAAPAASSPGGTELAGTVTTAPASTTSRGVTTAAPATTAVPTTGATSTTAPTVLAFPSVPTGSDVQAKVASTGQAPQPAEGSACGDSVTPPPGAVLTGFVPITVNGAAGEALFYRSGSGSGATTVVVVRTSSCQAFS